MIAVKSLLEPLHRVGSFRRTFRPGSLVEAHRNLLDIRLRKKQNHLILNHLLHGRDVSLKVTEFESLLPQENLHVTGLKSKGVIRLAKSWPKFFSSAAKNPLEYLP